MNIMNDDHIKALADRAHQESVALYYKRMETEHPSQVIFYDIFNRKFAELIVRECAKVAGDFEYARLHDSLVEDKILEHFGVES